MSALKVYETRYRTKLYKCATVPYVPMGVKRNNRDLALAPIINQKRW
jgi:hypothetical protein